jgi:hypothetical protein
VATFTLYVKVVRVKGARITIIEYGIALLFVLCTVTVVVEDVVCFFMLVCGTVNLVHPRCLTSRRRGELQTWPGLQS